MKVRIKVATVMILIVVGISTANYLTSRIVVDQNLYDSLNEEINQNLSLVLNLADRMVATKIDLLVSEAAAAARRLARADLSGDVTETVLPIMREYPDFKSLTVFNRDGLLTNYGEPVSHDIYHNESSFLMPAFSGRTVICPTHFNSTANSFVMHIFTPMGPDLALCITLPGTLFADILADFRLWQSGSIFIVDSEGSFVATRMPVYAMEQQNTTEDARADSKAGAAGDFFKTLVSHEHGSGKYFYDGRENLCVYKRISNSVTNWFIGVAAPISESPIKKLQTNLLVLSLIFLVTGIAASIIISKFAARIFSKLETQNINLENLNKTVKAQSDELLAEYEGEKVLLSATPLACHLWNKNLEIFECNEEAVWMFNLRDKQDFLDRFFDFSPKYQSDGTLSRDKALHAVERVFYEGRSVMEYMHQLQDGTPLPTEITLIRVKYKDDYIVASYLRDLREQKKMNRENEQRDHIQGTVNQVANILLQSEVSKFESDLLYCMGMIGKAVNADRVYIWKNHKKGGSLYCTQLYKWSAVPEPREKRELTENVLYSEKLPGWEKTLSVGNCISGLVRNMSPAEQKQLSSRGTLSVFIVPVLVRDQFWGFAGFNDCVRERLFSKNEQSILRTGSLIIANALLRNEMTLSLFEAVDSREIALKKAREANSAKTSFLARMSHEMRTPLNAVIGLSKLILEAEDLSDENTVKLENIYEAGATLLSTVNDILDISKIEAEKFELNPVEYIISSLLNDTITQSIMHIGEKPIQFVLNIDENLPLRLYGDELRIKQILNNLLSNAFKYTKKGKVELEMKHARDKDTIWITICVRDTGIGIHPDNIKKVFEDYSQVDMKANRKIMGTGLGLPITKRLIELMGGTITLESEYGKGSAFTARIPQQFVNDAVIGAGLAENLKSFRYSRKKRQQDAKQMRISLPYAHVLIVDDVMTNLDVAKGLMKLYNMQIDCMTSGQEAIDAIRSEKVRYNAVFMDHMMPGMDGIEATRIIREIGTEYAKTVPIIALTADAIVGNEQMFLSSGFQAFISKPIELNRLDAVIRKWVRDKGQEKTLISRAVNLEGNTSFDNRGQGSGLDSWLYDQKVPGVDIKNGLRHFDGNAEVYLNILRSYATNTGPLLKNLKEPVRENLKNYAIIVHGIKGSSRGISANTAGDLAEALENAAKAGDFDFVISNNQRFLETEEKLIAGIAELLAKTESDIVKPKKEKPDEKILSKLLDACTKYDMDGADAAMGELESCEYESGGEIVPWLRHNVHITNFEKIVEKLTGISGG